MQYRQHKEQPKTGDGSLIRQGTVLCPKDQRHRTVHRPLDTKEMVKNSLMSGAWNIVAGYASGMGNAIGGMPHISETTRTVAAALEAVWAVISETVIDIVGLLS